MTAEGIVDPDGVHLTGSTPDAAGGAGDDLLVVAANEDPELLLLARSDRRDGGLREPLLEQGQIERVGFALDDEVVRAIHRLWRRLRG